MCSSKDIGDVKRVPKDLSQWFGVPGTPTGDPSFVKKHESGKLKRCKKCGWVY